MLWDGLMFFGFDDTKLARLNGAKTSYLDKFKNKKWLIKNIIGLTIVLYVILGSLSKLGQIKQQKVELTEREHFNHKAKDILTLHAVNYFDIDQMLNHVQKV